MSSVPSQSVKISGLSPENYNYFKCWFVLINNGREVFQTIFEWGFGKQGKDIKNSLMNLPNYSNSRYRSDFYLTQRKQIENGDIKEFDLSLLYLLLQRLCSLPSESLWCENGGPDTLPAILYQIKKKRNDFAHLSPEITEVEMVQITNDLMSLFGKALDVSAATFKTDKNMLLKVKETINTHILYIQRSTTPLNKQNMKELAEEKAKIALHEAQSDLFNAYKLLSKILLAPWTAAENFQNVNDIFVEPTMKQTKSNILYQQMSEEESIVYLENILASKILDGSIPNFILILSQSGMGKTTVVKYLIQSWLERKGLIKGLDTIDLVLYLDCRVCKVGTFDELILSLMPNTVKIYSMRELKVIIMTLEILVIMDNVDEIADEAFFLYEELINLNSDKFRILATSSQNLSRALNKKLHQKHMKLQLEGISATNINSCVIKMYASLQGCKNASKSDEDIEMFISEYISKTHLHSNEAVSSPEILSHVFFQWLLQNRNEPYTYTTKAHLFVTTHELLCLKIVEKIGVKTQTKLFEEKIFYDNLNAFFNEIFCIAFKTLERNEIALSPATFSELINVCETSNLPHSVLKEILWITESGSCIPLRTSASITFPSNSLHVFYAAMHIVNVLSNEKGLKLEMLSNKFFENSVTRNNFELTVKFILGIISLNDILKFESITEDIFMLVTKYCESPETSLWLELVEEARCHPTVMEIAKKFMGDIWSLEDHTISAGLIAMLQNHPPKKICLTTCKAGDSYYLHKALEICSHIPDLTISLHLYHNFWVNKTQVCDSYLGILLEDKTINIESFAGKLSSQFFSRIPSTLRRLALHIKPEDISILNSAQENLRNLSLLYLNLDIAFNYPPRSISRLKMPGRDSSLYVDLWNIEEDHIEWGCDVLSRFSPAYCRLALRKSSLDYKDARRFLEGVRNRRIHLDSFLIGSTKSFTEEEETNLRDFGNCFECNEVRLIKV